MRYAASEKLEIIRTVEASHLSARQTLATLGIPTSTYYRWYDRWSEGGLDGLEDVAPQIDAACDGDWSVDKLLEVGERIWNLERNFNNAAGFSAADDKLPERLVKDAAKTGPAKGLTNQLDKMLPEYYELRGWTTDGVPTNETLSRLGL